MNAEELLKFKESLSNFSLEELEKAAEEVQKEIMQMVLNSDAVARASIIDQLIKAKKGQ